MNPTSAEIFDVVDDHDAVIGQRPRAEVHRLGLKHRAVHVLVFNALGQVFLQRRSMAKDCFPGVWDSSASGHLDHGEDYDACAVRELMEEIGLGLAVPPRRLFKIHACVETGQEFCWVYVLNSEGPFQLHPDEIAEAAWFHSDEITRWTIQKPAEFAPAFILIWNRWLKEASPLCTSRR